MESKICIKSLTLNELENLFISINEPKYRALQVFSWLSKGVISFDDMTNISKELKEKLEEITYVNILKIEKKLVSKIDGTVKYLFKLMDNEFIESVVMEYKHGISICISTQVGCKMGCSFCASTIGGFKRNLSTAELIDQIIFSQLDYGKRISSVVLMGIGEPLDNYDNLIKFLEIVNNKNGLNISLRHISVSTCGIVDKIYLLAEKRLQITLSVSIHAPNDTLRNKLLPINFKWGVDELINSCHYYIDETGRRISFEYTLIDGVNDKEENALELARILKGMLCHINLITVNKVKERNYIKSNINTVNNFSNILKSKGLNVTVRRVLGADINASCGQLRRDSIDSDN